MPPKRLFFLQKPGPWCSVARRRAGQSVHSHKRIGQQQLRLPCSPLLRWQALQEHDDALEVHLPQLVVPPVEKSRADVEMKVGKGVGSLGLWVGK